MPFDGLTAYAVTQELKTKIIGTKVHKIYQPVKDEIILFFSDREKNTLLLCANPSFPRLHLITNKIENPDYPPAFCMLLRKYLLGGIVTDVTQKDFDRILTIHFETLDETGSLLNLSLITEIMGRHSNIMLVNDKTGKILDSAKHITRLKSSVREVMPGKDYVFPPNEKINPLNFDKDDAAQRLSFFRDKSMSNALVSVFTGLSNQLSISLLQSFGYDFERPLNILDIQEMISLCEKVQYFFVRVKNIGESFIYIDNTGKYKDFSFGDYSIYDGYKKQRFETINKAAEEFYLTKSISNHIHEKYEAVIKNLSQLLAKEENKLIIREEELKQAEDCEQFNIAGNLLLSNMHLLKKGMKQITVENYYAVPYENKTIELRADRTPSANAQMYFKKYAKAKSAIVHLTKLIEESKEEIYYLSSQLYYLTNAQNAAEADEVITELIKRNIVKKKKSIQKPQGEPKPYHFITKDGYEIFVGKNDKQNDKLTLKTSSKDDIWLHTKDIPGSHVILKTNQGSYSEDALKDAAVLAAYYSKAGDSANVPVDYAFVKYVKKPTGAPLGRVIYTNQKTIFVTPSEDAVKKIRQM